MKNEEDEQKTRWQKLKKFYWDNFMTANIVLALVLGCLAGTFLVWVKSDWTKRQIMYISYPGELNMRALQVFALPQMVALLVVSVGGVEVSMTGGMAVRTVAYYLTTSALSVANGMLLVTTIRPGHLAYKEDNATALLAAGGEEAKPRRLTVDVVMDMGRNLFPPNLVQTALESYQTRVLPTYDKDGNLLEDERDWTISQGFHTGFNFLGVISFCVVLGLAIQVAGEKGKPFLGFFESFLAVIMVLVRFNIKTAPIGIFFIVLGTLMEKGGDVMGLLASLGAFIGTVTLSLLIHSLITLPVLFFLVTRKQPFAYMRKLTKIVGTIFGTGSSVATLPVSMACLQDDCRVDPEIVGFVLPVGANINFDGSSMYEAVAVVFVAQYWGVDMQLQDYLVIALTAAGAPQGGVMTMIMLLQTVGLPATAIGLVLPVDWLLNRMRSTVNVLGDCMVAGALQILLKGGFDKEKSGDEESGELEEMRER